MIILAVDSSAVTASCAIFDGEKILSSFYTNAGLTHSQTLMPMVDSILKNINLDLSSIDAFAVNVGPGSFTGLRIGIACVKGMAMALCKPCIGVSTLECIAYNGIDLNGIICSVMDARCNQVYNALFKAENGTLTRLCCDRAISLEDLKNELLKADDDVYLFGDGAFIAKKALNGNNIILPSVKNIYQNAESLAVCAYSKNEIVSAEALMPVYLRLSQAERELKNKNKTEEKQ